MKILIYRITLFQICFEKFVLKSAGKIHFTFLHGALGEKFVGNLNFNQNQMQSETSALSFLSHHSEKLTVFYRLNISCETIMHPSTIMGYLFFEFL